MNMTRRPVAVTGVGCVTPLGRTAHETWQSLLASRRGVVRPQPPLSLPHAPARISSTELQPWLTNVKAQEPRFIALALAATGEAMRDAGLSVADAAGAARAATGWDPTSTGVVIGSGMGGAMREIADAARDYHGQGRKLSPFFVPRMLSNSAAGHVAIVHNLQGPNSCPSTACASGAQAVVDATRLIERGDCDVVVCGGTESSMDVLSMEGFHRLRALSTCLDPNLASRPFDVNRDGFVMGEGAGVLVLEALDHALKRGAPRVYATVAGCGMSGDAHHFTASSPDGKGAELAMRRALKDAGLGAPFRGVAHVNAHATSTPLGDLAEVSALSRVFEGPVVVTSVKGATGHLLGAAGAVEAIATVLALYHGQIPPNTGLETLDPQLSALANHPGLKLSFPVGAPVPLVGEYALSNSFGFGGTNVSVVFRAVTSSSS